MTRQILCTVGPASLQGDVIPRLSDLGVALFRINLSHTALGDVERVIDTIRQQTEVPICLDTEGAQVRTGYLVPAEILVRENSLLTFHRNRVPGDPYNINLYPLDIVDVLAPGDLISVDFNAVLVQVIEKQPGKAITRVLHGGSIGRNKAVTIERDVPLDVMTEKDRAALAIGSRVGIRHVALSFASHGQDVDEVRRCCAPDVTVISKVESRVALANLDSILARTDAILIDRGDLSRQEPLERIPYLQKAILARAAAAGRPGYVATNLLESMVTASRPTRAEVNDVINTLRDGASGLVLAAETAIGRNPVACVTMIARLIKEFELHERDEAFALRRPVDLSRLGESSLLVPLHGRPAIPSIATSAAPAPARPARRFRASARALHDARALLAGHYAPLSGFMDAAEITQVLEHDCLRDGTPWPLPIALRVDATAGRALAAGDALTLLADDGSEVAIVDVVSTFTLESPAVLARWRARASGLPGESPAAPGSVFVAGPVRLPVAAGAFGSPFVTAGQTRLIFAHKGWSRVLGVDARFLPRIEEERVQLELARAIHADGLLIAVPPDAGGDDEVSVENAYRLLQDFGHYPIGRSFVSVIADLRALAANAHAAVLRAIVLKNAGCSDVAITPAWWGAHDDAGVANLRATFAAYGDLGLGLHFLPQPASPPLDADALVDALARRDDALVGSVRDEIRDLILGSVRGRVEETRREAARS